MLRQAGDGMSVLREVGLRSRGEWFLRQFDMSARAFARAEVHDEVIRRSFKPLVETAAVAGMLLITLTLLWRGEAISAIVPVLALFGAAAFRLLPSFEKMINHYDQIQYRGTLLALVYDDLTALAREQARIETAYIKDAPIRFEHAVSIENVAYVYPNAATPALRSVSLTIKKGEAIGLIGPTGGGKTTMVDLITGLLEPAVGVVRVDGRDIREHLPSWQERIGYVPQSVYLADATIRQNVTLGIDTADVDKEMLERAVRMAQLEEFVDKLPSGLDTMVGERGVRLSGGQRQRIGIARALYADPEILIFDEATSALDNQTEAYVIEAIERLKRDRTIVMIAHRLSTVKNCDRLVVLRDGEVQNIGTYEEIISST
jgi:ATP-binding cassette subfamily C protein